MHHSDITPILLTVIVALLLFIILIWGGYETVKKELAALKNQSLGLKTPAEIRCGINRIKMAENLIMQLPNEHHGRNAWLMYYGNGLEAAALRKVHNTKYDYRTQAAEVL